MSTLPLFTTPISTSKPSLPRTVLEVTSSADEGSITASSISWTQALGNEELAIREFAEERYDAMSQEEREGALKALRAVVAKHSNPQMAQKKVLARAWGGKPLERVELRRDLDVAYLCNPLALEALAVGRTFPIGFPLEDVFAFDAGLYQDLMMAYSLGESARVSALWARAHPSEG